jgi:hypothetical protein
MAFAEPGNQRVNQRLPFADNHALNVFDDSFGNVLDLPHLESVKADLIGAFDYGC